MQYLALNLVLDASVANRPAFFFDLCSAKHLLPDENLILKL